MCPKTPPLNNFVNMNRFLKKLSTHTILRKFGISVFEFVHRT